MFKNLKIYIIVDDEYFEILVTKTKLTKLLKRMVINKSIELAQMSPFPAKYFDKRWRDQVNVELECKKKKENQRKEWEIRGKLKRDAMCLVQANNYSRCYMCCCMTLNECVHVIYVV